MTLLARIAVLVFIIFYPMLISIYVFLPLLIGVMGYILIQGIEEEKVLYVLIALLYFLNLEVNLSLPFLLLTISTLVVYVLFYPSLHFFRSCGFCSPIMSVLLIDAVYMGSLLSYDFLFQSNSIVIDNILFYSLMVDVALVVFL